MNSWFIRGKKLKVLVTGGAGFIGSHLVGALLSKGHEVRVIDNLYSGSLDNIRGFKNDPSFHFQEKDIRDKDEVAESIRNIDAVFHEAAITSVPKSIEEPEFTKEVNVEGTKNLLERCVEKEVKKFIFASSCAVYGEPEEVPLSEDSQCEPTSPYAESKLTGEKICREYADREEIETVALRYFNVYGPGRISSRSVGVISKFLDRIEEGKSPVIYGDGEQTRDFVHVEDVVRANLLSLEKEELMGEVFNIGSGRAVTINELCEKLLKASGNPGVDPIYEDHRPGDIHHSEANISKARGELGYKPEVNLVDGLKEIVERRRDKNSNSYCGK